MNQAHDDSLIGHLLELRNRLMKAMLAILVGFIVLVPFAAEIYAALAKPMLAALPAGGRMIATDVTTPFFVPMKVTLLAAFLIALPVVLYQLWAFIAPGLYRHERRLVAPLVASSVIMFAIGMAFAYFAVFPVVFGFMVKVSPVGVEVMTDIEKYLSFVIGLFVAFGISFEVPVVVVVLVRMGLVSIEQLKKARPYVIVGAFVVGAVFTPPDVISQLMLAVPLCLLFEAGLLVSRWMSRKPKNTTESESTAE